MNIAEAKQQIKDTVDAYLAQDETGAYVIPSAAQRPLFLLGAPGIGKTAIVEQVASELGVGLVPYSMTHHTRQSALGLPFIVERTYGNTSFQVSEYTMSEIIASVYDYMDATGRDRGILFLDEINCVSETLYPSMLQFLQFKTFGRHQVPNGWVIVCAGNPPEYDKSVHEFDVVTLDRLRKLEVEPDLDAWLSYAHATGVHPAIVSYLDVKRDHFYAVESTPSGKTFVTARGWDDLSRVIRLFEAQGKPVNRMLAEQFLQNDQIAERFAQYYLLFSKYRSDYQVASILAGNASEEIRQRAKAARFDERLALIRLMLDGLSSRLGSVLESEQVAVSVRDALREAKPRIVEGGLAREILEAAANSLDADAAKCVSLDMATDADMRPQRLAAARLRAYAGACEQKRTTEGEAAFSTITAHYTEDTQRLRSSADEANVLLDNAFAFIEEEFADDREMAAFMAELTTRRETSQFVSRFGSETYYAHSGIAQAKDTQQALRERIEALDLQAVADAAAQAEAKRAEAQRKASSCGSCCGGGC
mgnify:CR=1 FL=1